MSLIFRIFFYHILFKLIRFGILFLNHLCSKLRNIFIRRNIKEKYVIITGATDGIGKALSIEFSLKKTKLILFGRNETKLEEIKKTVVDNGSSCVTFLMDFAQECNFKQLFDSYDVGVLINNAGCCSEGPFYFAEDNRMVETVQVNLLNTFKITQEVLKGMMAKKQGYIINIGSITGDIPVPFISTYGSTKSCIKAWSESLYHELKKFNINIECMDTGYVTTKMSKIRKSNFFTPTPQIYAKSLINIYGSNFLTFPYFPHLISNFVLTSLLPRRLISLISYYYNYKIKKIIEKKSKQKTT